MVTGADLDRPATTRRGGSTDPAVGAGARPRRRPIPLVAPLFAATPPTLTGRWRALFAAVAVVVGTVASLGRVRGPGFADTLFGEDGSLFLQDTWNRSMWDAFTNSFNGYHLMPQRLLAEVAGLAPIRWGPAVLTVQAAAGAALLALLVFVACAGHLRGTLSRLVVSVPIVALPVSQGIPYALTSGSVDNNVATVQFPLVYATFWVLLWVPTGRGGRVVAIATAAVCSFGTILAVTLAPLVLMRLLVRRDRTDVLVAGALGTGMAFQVGSLLLGFSTRGADSVRRYDPVWVLTEYVVTMVPRAVLGEVWLAPPVPHTKEHAALIVAAWLVIGVAVAVAALRLTAPNWRLAVLAAGTGLVVWTVQLVSYGQVGSRYVVVPGLLTLVAVAALLRPAASGQTAPGRTRAARSDPDAGVGRQFTVAFATLLAVVCVANYRVDSWRSAGMPWAESVRQAREACADPADRRPGLVDPARVMAVVPYGHGWTLGIPCERLR